jgi:hypothetical protein
MDGLTCELCAGTLWDIRGGVHAGRPCPNCLTTPATDEVRAVAREWLGFDVWANPVVWQGPRAWIGEYHVQDLIPAYLPAGRDLLVRVLAKRLDVNPWDLLGAVWLFADDDVGELMHMLGDACPSLDDLPPDAPADLRAGRALVLCIQALETP